MAAQITLPVTCEYIAASVTDKASVDIVKTATNTGTAAEQQDPLSDEDLMPFYFLSMAGSY
ncbi:MULTISPECIES: hypothetical protein [Paraburkholderia]|uniref:hypothetical protein n=1 Tax=Paraburkholderia TaxID=1822464 RepID=UPI00115FC8A8|nr:hypothetical protein [Paraburkholderia fungorum]